MKLPRRQFLHLAASAAALHAVSRTGGPQAYPTKPIRWIIGFPAGGGADTVARIMEPWLLEAARSTGHHRKPVGRFDQHCGQAVVNSPPDGYTLLWHGLSSVVNASLFYQPAIRHPARYRSNSRRRQLSDDHGRASLGAGEVGGRVTRACQGQSRQGHHGVVRHRISVASGRRTVQVHGRRRHGSRSLSR